MLQARERRQGEGTVSMKAKPKLQYKSCIVKKKGKKTVKRVILDINTLRETETKLLQYHLRTFVSWRKKTSCLSVSSPEISLVNTWGKGGGGRSVALGNVRDSF